MMPPISITQRTGAFPETERRHPDEEDLTDSRSLARFHMTSDLAR